MNKILFRSLKIKNFLSIGETPIEINFENGINLITGENLDNNTRNGVGKSSLIEAIYWCLFGKTIREIKNDKIVHGHSKSIVEVLLKLEVQKNDKTLQYSIKRCLNPSKIEISCDNNDITLSTIPSNDAFIKKILNANEELFNNAVIMTANNTLPFMAQKKVDKRKFLEGVFNLNIFGEMLLKARSDFNDIKKQNDILSNSFINEQKNLEIFEKQKEKNEEIKNKKIKEYSDKIIDIQKEIKEVKNNTLNIDKIDQEIKKFEDALINFKLNLEKKEKELKNYTNNYTEIRVKLETILNNKKELEKKGEVCPVCNREYSEKEIISIKEKLSEYSSKIEEYEKTKQNLKEKMQESENKIKNIKESIFKIENKIKNLSDSKNKEEIKEEKIKNLEEKIKNLEDLIKEKREEKNDSENQIEKIKKSITQIEENLKEVKTSLSTLDNVKFVLSEEGVKTFIVKKLLDVLNDRLNFYLKKLEAPCTCYFNEQFEETITNSDGKECSYFNFSGGERKRIDIAILFMFQDILRYYSGTFFSLSMYDELFDSAIDETGIEKILEILKNRVDLNGESIYIISHNKLAIKNNFNNVILLQKNKNKTLLVS